MGERGFYATGKRKTAVARVWLRPGNGNIKINNTPMDNYFARGTSKMILQQPLELTNTAEKFDVIATAKGGGHSGQAGAIKHGISRALLLSDPGLRAILKKAGFLTRDSRIKERKKYGQRGARARFQYSKR